MAENEIPINFIGNLTEFKPDGKPLAPFSMNGAVVILGAGGVGWWTVAALARCEDITNPIVVYDADDFRGGNGRKRLPIPLSPLRRKVEELREWIAEWTDPTRVIHVRPYFADRRILALDNSNIRLLVDCTDAPMTSRQDIYQWACKVGVPYVRGSYDGEMITFSHTPPMTVENGGTYALLPNMAVTFAAGGLIAEAIRRTLAGESVPTFTHHFGGVTWRSATGNVNEQAEITESIAAAIRHEQSLAEQIQTAIDEGDPLVIGEDGEVLGRESEFEMEVEDETEIDTPVEEEESDLEPEWEPDDEEESEDDEEDDDSKWIAPEPSPLESLVAQSQPYPTIPLGESSL